MICPKHPTNKKIPFFIIHALHIKITKHKKREAPRTIQISSDFASLHNSQKFNSLQLNLALILSFSIIHLYIYIYTYKDRIFYMLKEKKPHIEVMRLHYLSYNTRTVRTVR